jgi:F0F1-type ATP synthase assembly protein I
MTLKVPEPYRKMLRNGTIYELEGTIDRKFIDDNELNIYLSFRLTRIVGEEAPLIDEKGWESVEILRARHAKSRHNIDALLRTCFKNNQRPRVAMIYGSTGITIKDVEEGMAEQWQNYEITKAPINLSSKEEITETLRRLDDSGAYDLIAVFRGGGAGLEIFSDNDIARAVVQMKTPIVTGIGHADDKPFIEGVADQACITPTALGHYLRETARATIKDISWLNGYYEERRQLKQTIQTLSEKAESLQIENTTLYKEKADQPAMIEPVAVPLQQYTFRQKAAVLLVGILIGVVVGVGLGYFFELFGQHSPTPHAAQTVSPAADPQSPPTTPSAANGNIKNNSNKRRRP